MKSIHTKIKLLSCLLVMLSVSAFAQLPMTRSIFTGTYTPISTGTGATLTTIAGDDGTQAALPIGFTFNYLGTNYTTVDGCANGWISFNSGGANSWTNTNLWTATVPNFTLAAWWDDLNVGTGSVIYQTQGTPGSQTFTVQWTDVLSYNGSTRTLNFQIILYEGTNVIEFRYSQAPFANPMSTSESASIGIEGTGGAGQFIDAVTGSAFINNSYLTTSCWPRSFYRFTPGAPTVLAGGTYTVGTSGTYTSLTEAIANINHRGISGPVTLSLIDANYDTTTAGGYNIFPIMLGPVAGNSSVNTITIQPASGTSTLTFRGTVSGSAGNQGSPTAMGTTSQPILAIVGTDYVNVSNLNLQTTGNGLVDRGLLVVNNTTTDGATNNVFENISVTLNRTNTSSVAIQQNVLSIPASAAGANSNNTYRNLTISNTYSGIFLLGNATFPDLGNTIGNTSPTTFNSIGSATANDIGGTSVIQNYGIRCGNQSDVSVYNNEVRNVSTSTTSDGILMELCQGNCNVYRNIIHDIKNVSTTSTSLVCGIRGNVATTAGHNLYIYNNFVYGVNSGYTGAASATRQMKGIFVQSVGGGVTTSSINVDNNTVSIDGSSSANISSSTFEIGTATGPVMNVRNNVFHNGTGAQTLPAGHYVWASPSATTTGNTGSVSNFNDLYVTNTTQGFAGLGAATTFATLANWQAAMTGQDVNSVSTDPSFNSSTDLHVNSPSINNVATPLAWVTSDIDNQARSATTPDMGADEFAPATLDAGATLLVTPVAGNCYTSTETVTIRVKNFAASTLDFSVNPVTVTVNVTGAVTATINTTVTSGLLAPGATTDIVVGTLNMTTAGIYTFNAFTTLAGDPNALNDAMPAANINYSAGAANATPPNICAGSNVTLTLSGNTASSIQWEASTDGGLTWNAIAGATTSPYVYTPADTTLFRALMCGVLLSTTDTIFYFPTTAPVTTNDTICGTGTPVLGASGAGTLYWYDAASGGNQVASGTTYSPVVTATDTFYVESSSGSSGGVQVTTFAAGNGSSGNMFTITALNTVTITGFDGHVTSGTSNWRIDYRPDNYLLVPGANTSSVGWLPLGTATNVPAGGTGNPTPIPIAFSVTIPAGQTYSFHVMTTGGSGVNYTNGTGAGNPYITNSDFIFREGHGGISFNCVNVPRVFNGRIHYSTGCTSSRTPVIAVVNTTAPVTITAGTPAVCAGDSTSLTANSVNMGYTYTWTPAATLSSSTGSTVMAAPSVATTYIVAADSANCHMADTISIGVNQLPTGTVTVSDSLICIGGNSNLEFVNGFNGYASVANNTAVPDGNAIGAYDSLTVSGVPTSLQAGDLVSVCINMTHTWDGDMSFTLISPTGTMFDLCSGNGGAGDNFTGTCFSMSAATNITAGVAPFTGSFIPEGAGGFNVFNGENANGEWKLWMVDGGGGDVGVLLDWSITFAAPTLTYSWTSNPVGFTSTLDSVNVTPITSTQYTLQVTNSVTGCMLNILDSVMVNPPLALTMSADTTICSGGTISISGNGTGGDGNITYAWSSGGTTNSETVTPSVSTTYTLTITDGCGTPSAVDSVMVNIAAPLALSSITADTMMCASTPIVLSATVTGGVNVQYAWSNGPTTSVDSITSGAPGTSTTYYLNITETCSTSLLDSITVSTYAAPTVMVSNDTTVCGGDTVVMNAMGMGGFGAYTYSWSNGPVTALDSVIASGNSVYYVNVTDACAQTAVDSVIISAFAAPTVTTSNDTAICYPNPAYLSAMGSGGDGSYTYLWSDGTSTANDTVAFFGPSVQTVSVTITDGCGNTAVDSVVVTVNVAPLASFTVSGTQPAFTFTSTSSNATSYNWNFGDSQTSTLQNPTHTYSSNGSYTVTLVVTNSCGSDTITQIVNVDVGVTESFTLLGVNAYPNPATEQVTISFNGMHTGDAAITLMDARGRLVYAQNVAGVTAGTVITLNLNDFESGVYMLNVTMDNTVGSARLIINK